MFSKLVLERFLMELPQEISAYYHSLLFNRKTQRLFNEEMLYTIEMFFKKDLNLSDTARQLYITGTRWFTGWIRCSARQA